MQNPGPVTAAVYDIYGRLVTSISRDVWNSGNEQTISTDMENSGDGVYFVVVKGKSAAGSGKFILTQ